jgi:hypothetical protein
MKIIDVFCHLKLFALEFHIIGFSWLISKPEVVFLLQIKF